MATYYLPDIPIADRSSINRTATSQELKATNVSAKNKYIPMLYGEGIFGGRIFVAAKDGDDLLIGALFCLGEIQEFVKIYINDDDVPAGVTVNEHKGTTTQTADSILSNISGYSDTLVLDVNGTDVGVAYIALRIPPNLVKGYPRITAKIKGFKDIYDPRDLSTAYSDNPALCFRNWLKSSVYGPGYSTLDSTFETAANFCDEVPASDWQASHNYSLGDFRKPTSGNTLNRMYEVTTDAGSSGGTEPSWNTTLGATTTDGGITWTCRDGRRHIANMVMDRKASVSDWIKTWRTACGCMVNWGESGIEIIPDKARATDHTFLHASGEILEKPPISLIGKRPRDIPTVVKVIYTNISNLPWRDGEVRVPADGVDAGTTPVRDSIVRCPWIHRYSEAKRIATQRLKASSLTDLRFSLPIFDEGLKVKAGDVVEATHPIGLSAKKMRVLNVNYPILGRPVLDLYEYDANVYSNLVESEPTYFAYALNTGVDIVPPLPSDENLKGYWSLDELLGDVAKDSSGNSNDGTLQNMEDADWVGGISGKCLDFGGTNEYVSVSHNAVFDFGTDSFSVSYWMRFPTGSSQQKWSIGKGNPCSAAGPGWAISHWTTGDPITPNLYFSDGVNVITRAFDSMNRGIWYHLIFVVDRSTNLIKAYTNGEYIGNVSISGYGSINSTDDLLIGAGNTTSNISICKIDEVRIYKKALTAQEIKALYLYPSGQKSPLPGADITANSTFVTVTYPADQSDLQTQIDGKIISWFQASDPQPTWEGSDASHAGDMWWNTSSKKLKRYTGSAWSSDIEDQKAIDAYSNAATAQDTADGKRRVFVATPTTPYDIGDLWVAGPAGDIKKCKTTRASGAYQAGDWELASDYDNTANNPQDLDWLTENATNVGTISSTGWYRIASNSGDRAQARFIVRNTESQRHNTAEFTAGVKYNAISNIGFTLTAFSKFSTQTLTKVRFLTKDTYDAQYLEVYVNNPAGTEGGYKYWILDNVESSGWTAIDWTAGNIPGGYTATEYNIGPDEVVDVTANQFTNSLAVIDLEVDKVEQGLDASGNVITKVLPGSNIGTPAGSGLFLGSDLMGYYSGSVWKVYIDDSGHFVFKGDANNYISWDGTNFHIRGKTNADDIIVGTLSVDRLAASFLTAAHVGANEVIAHSANIKEAIVDTLQLAGQAVTIPVGAYSDSLQYFNNTPTSVLTASITSTGAPIIITMHCLVTRYSQSFNEIALRIYRDTTALAMTKQGKLNLDNGALNLSMAYKETPGAGTYTYKMYLETSGPETTNAEARNRSIILLEVKK